MSEPESTNELVARRELEHVLGRRLARVRTDDRPSPDYQLTSDDGLPAAFEVKELVSEDWIYIQKGMNEHETSVASDQLRLHWCVSLAATTTAQRLTPPPDFSEDDEMQIAWWEARGLRVKRRAERIAEWKARSQTPPKSVRIKGMIEGLIPELVVLEQHAIRNTLAPGPYHSDVYQALFRIARRTRGATCLGYDPMPDKGLPAGIQILSGLGSIRTGRSDTLALRIQAWLDSDLSTNLIASLDRDEYGQGHGVLVFDHLEPERLSAYEEPDSYLPSRELDLPASVDVIWALVGPVVLRYSVGNRWQRYDRVAPN